MYAEIGSFDAKTRLAELLRAVERGERFTITLRGRPVADLIPTDSAARMDEEAAIQAMLQMPKITGRRDEEVAEWIAEGRR